MRIATLLAVLVLLAGCEPREETTVPELPRIAIAGLAIESSTFSPARTHAEAFRPLRGGEVFTRYPFYAEGSPLRARAEFVPTLTGKAIPGGIVTREAYESLLGETLERLREGLPYDGLFLDLHGAMSVEGLDDPEGDFIESVREVVGDDTLISTSMDLHGNVSRRLARETDLIRRSPTAWGGQAAIQGMDSGTGVVAR